MTRAQYKKMTALLLAFVMIFALTACKQETKPIYTIDGFEISVGLYLNVQQNAYGTAMQKVFEQELTETSTQADQIIIQNDILKYTIDDIKVDDWINKETLRILENYVAINKEFSRLGLELSDDDNKAIDESAKSTLESSEKIFNYLGISLDALKEAEVGNIKGEKVYEAYYIEDGSDKKVSVDDAYAYLTENLYLAY